MAYHDDLLRHAVFLSELDLPEAPKQVDLRRAVSAAYYALFHLLTVEAAQNWRRERQRSRFARMFDHGRMKTCSSKVASRPLPRDPAENAPATLLKLVAESFVNLQHARHTADYDNAYAWSRTDVWDLILDAEDAIKAWMGIRETTMAQDYLIDGRSITIRVVHQILCTLRSVNSSGFIFSCSRRRQSSFT